MYHLAEHIVKICENSTVNMNESILSDCSHIRANNSTWIAFPLVVNLVQLDSNCMLINTTILHV